MQNRLWLFGLNLVISAGLVAGCGSPHPHPPGAGKVTTPAAARVPAPSLADRLAEAHAHFGAAIIAEMNDDSEAALKEYYQAAFNDPANEGLCLEVSRRFLQHKQPEKALELITRSAERPEASGAIYARLSLVYSELGRREQAIVAARIAIKKSPRALAGYQNLFLNYLQSKQIPQAIKALDDASHQPNPDAEFLVGLGELFSSAAVQVPAEREKLHTQARQVLQRADKLAPASPGLRLRLADNLGQAGDSQRAAAIYQGLLKSLPEAPILRERVHAKLAEIYLRNNDRTNAFEQLQAIVKEDPTSPQAYYYLGSLAYDEKKLAEAADFFHKTILLNPDFEPPYYDLALAQINQDKTEEALATLDSARKRFPQNFIMEFWTGLAYARQKNYAAALPHFTTAEVVAKATDPKRLNEFFYFQAGAAYERTGNLDQAARYFEKCLEIAPGAADAMNYLGYMWAEHGTNLDKARTLIEKAVKAEPKNAAYLDSLGWVLFQLKQPKEALVYLLRAVELSTEPDATVFDHLGDVYLALNEVQKAREAWNRSLSLEPNDQVRKKLAQSPQP